MDIISTTVDSKELEYGPETVYAVFSSLGFGVGGQSYSNFLAATVYSGVALQEALACGMLI